MHGDLRFGYECRLLLTKRLHLAGTIQIWQGEKFVAGRMSVAGPNTLRVRDNPRYFFSSLPSAKFDAPKAQLHAADFQFIYDTSAENAVKFDFNIVRRSPAHDFN